MNELKIIDVKESIFDANNKEADELRAELREKKIFMINLMSSPGAGKTTLLTAVIDRLKDKLKIGVMEADIDAQIDAERIQRAGARSIQLHTGGMCHMDAGMTRQGLEAFDIADLDLLILENVGNLVCPAEFDTGAHENVMLLSVPEGDDKPLKYPLIFQVSNLVIVTKIDTKSVFDFNEEAVVQRIHGRNPNAEVLFLSAKTGEGLDAFCSWLLKKTEEFRV
ncbi:MAG: hydrogenase nickel incorporation protein HypB [Parasporobacterium sp.]|nr:hydrogenase nickel incorporation protein HypB [Parasporobacterium sp.]